MNRICYILIYFLGSLAVLVAQDAKTQDNAVAGQNQQQGTANANNGALNNNKSPLDSMSVAERVLYIQSLSTNRNTKLNLIQAMENGTIPVDESALKALTVLAGDGTSFQNYTNGKEAELNNADIRMRAFGLLAKIGTEEARKVILNALNAEKDSMAMGAAFIALSSLAAPDDGGSQIQTINRAMRRDMVSYANESLADDYLKTVEKLAESVKGDSDTVDLLLNIVDSSYGYSTYSQKKAYSILRVIGA